jgi:hypothetical protein
MAKHKVQLDLGTVTIPKAAVYTGVSLRVRADGDNLGVFSFGRGGIYWKPGKKSYKKQLRLSWSRFANLLSDQM